MFNYIIIFNQFIKNDIISVLILLSKDLRLEINHEMNP